MTRPEFFHADDLLVPAVRRAAAVHLQRARLFRVKGDPAHVTFYAAAEAAGQLVYSESNALNALVDAHAWHLLYVLAEDARARRRLVVRRSREALAAALAAEVVTR